MSNAAEDPLKSVIYVPKYKDIQKMHKTTSGKDIKYPNNTTLYVQKY